MLNERARHRLAGTICAVVVALTPSAQADIDVLLHPLDEVVTVGDIIEIQIIVFSDSSKDQLLAALEMIFAWEPEELQLLGNHQDGAVELLASSFPTNHPSSLNESNPPKDGIGMYMAWAPLGDPVAATPEGTLLTTFMFEALEPATETFIDIVPFIGDPKNPDAKTIVFDGVIPNHDVTGTLTGAIVTILPACLGDLDNNGVVDVDDLFILLADWGPCDDPQDCPADLNMDGEVNVDDLFELLANWGKCP